MHLGFGRICDGVRVHCDDVRIFHLVARARVGVKNGVFQTIFAPFEKKTF